jgi:hypothetical protein
MLAFSWFQSHSFTSVFHYLGHVNIMVSWLLCFFISVFYGLGCIFLLMSFVALIVFLC